MAAMSLVATVKLTLVIVISGTAAGYFFVAISSSRSRSSSLPVQFTQMTREESRE